ncbi:MAG: SUMF1/EgtB/PvdO family nonheme iron enzyme [Synechococcaceae cyanobacterium]
MVALARRVRAGEDWGPTAGHGVGQSEAMGVKRRWRAPGVGLLVGLALLAGEAGGPRQGQARPGPSPVLSSLPQPMAPAPAAAAPAPVPATPSPGFQPGSQPTPPVASAASAGAAPPAAAADRSLDTLLKTQPVATAAHGLLLLVVVLVASYLVVLWLRPIWLLRLPDELVLPLIGSDHQLRLGKPFFRFWKYLPRVLDAWVAQHLSTIKLEFAGKETVKDRRLHLSLPVKVGETLEPEISPERLKQLEAVGRLVLISGEGGVGKTSLALRIASWALNGELTKQPVVPVLVERDLEQQETLLSRLRSRLEDLMTLDGQERDTLAPTEPLLLALLKRRRLLVILDHFSELGDESRKRLHPTADAFPSAWVIVTSRRKEDFAEKKVLHLRPQRLTADRLWPFFDAYLKTKKDAEPAAKDWDDDLLARSSDRLREITAGLVDAERGITVLLAKLYIDAVLAERIGEGVGVLPDSVPKLMLTYVRQVNATIPEADSQEQELVVRALQLLAQAAETELFRPGWVGRREALQALARAMAERQGTDGERERELASDGLPLLEYLVKRLQLVEEASDGLDLRLVFDPLADYLAALAWLRQLDREGPAAWERFLAQTLPAPGSEEADLALGFLRALYDSAYHAPKVLGLKIPPELLAQLAQRAAIDPERIAAEKERRRLRSRMDDLADPELAVRLQAIEELCRRRSREPMVTEALGRALASEQQDLVVREAAAIALAVLGGEASARALAKLVEVPVPAEATAEERGLRRTALQALGLAVARLPTEAKALRAELMGVLERHLHSDALDLRIEAVPDPAVLSEVTHQVEDYVAQLAASGGLEGLSEELIARSRQDLIDKALRQRPSDSGAAPGWAEHDARLPVLQGASRGLQLAASADLPLLGSGPGRRVPMLTLTALQEGEALRIRTQVVRPAVWKLPLPEWPGALPQQLELVEVEGGEQPIGSPQTEVGCDSYANQRDGCKDPQTQRPLNVEAQRTVRPERFALVRHPITQAQWQAVAMLPRLELELNPTPGTYKPDDLWERFAQPGALPVDSVSWFDCQEWLGRLNRWLLEQWSELGGQGAAPQLALPGEGQWEVACRAGATTPSPFHFGDTLDASWANYDGGYIYGSGRKGAYRQRPVPVGFFGLVNRWGLAELHGQLWEWCGDQWHPDPTGEGWPSAGQPWEGVDPALEALGTAQKEWRLLRGGSWFGDPPSCRAAFRYCILPGSDFTAVGVRPGCFSPPGLFLYT